MFSTCDVDKHCVVSLVTIGVELLQEGKQTDKPTQITIIIHNLLLHSNFITECCNYQQFF